MLFYDIFSTPLGPLSVVVDENRAVFEVYSSDADGRLSPSPNHRRSPDMTSEAQMQLQQYARGERRSFDLPLNPKGTEFQHRVWKLLVEIPYGKTRSYGELAAELGILNGSRAVGRANATNPIAIIVPCHRVIGSNGSLTGYAGGLPFKQRLLELEGAVRPSLFASEEEF